MLLLYGCHSDDDPNQHQEHIPWQKEILKSQQKQQDQYRYNKEQQWTLGVPNPQHICIMYLDNTESHAQTYTHSEHRFPASSSKGEGRLKPGFGVCDTHTHTRARTHTHTHTHSHTHARTHARTHTHLWTKELKKSFAKREKSSRIIGKIIIITTIISKA